MPDRFVPIPAKLNGHLWLAKDRKDTLDTLICACYEIAVHAVFDLQGNPANIVCDEGALFPEALCHRQAKAFAQRLLHDDAGVPLKGTYMTYFVRLLLEFCYIS